MYIYIYVYIYTYIYIYIGSPPVISWFINPINYSYRMLQVSYTIVMGIIKQLSYLGGPTL